MSLSAQTAENAKLDCEMGQTSYAMSALVDSGDHTLFTSSASIWSQKNGYAPVVRPDGLITGGVVIPDNAGVNNVVDISAITCYLAGASTSVGAGSITCVRGAGAATKYIINSVIVTAGGALSVLTGTGAAGAWSSTRGAAGGPPLITVGTIEVAQIKFDDENDAAVTSDEIFMIPGSTRDVWDYPLFEINHLVSADGLTPGGSISFQSALELSHVGPVVKGVYASYAAPIFAEVPAAADFVPPSNTHSVSSTQVYNGTIGGRSSSLGQGSFTAHLQSGISDAIVKLKDEFLTFKFFPDRYKSPYILCQGKLGVNRSFPAGDSMNAACTISASVPAVDVGA